MKKLIGYPSVDNLHNRDYSFFERNPIIPDMSVYNSINVLSSFFRNEKSIDCVDLNVNYREMLDDAITMSKAFRELGVKHGDIISVSMPNFYQGVVVYLAANRIGAITTFINSMSSIEEVLSYLNLFESSLFINYDKDETYNDNQKNIKSALEDLSNFKIKEAVDSSKKVFEDFKTNTSEGFKGISRSHAD